MGKKHLQYKIIKYNIEHSISVFIQKTLLVKQYILTKNDFYHIFFSSIKLTPLIGEFPGVEGQIWVDSEQHVEEMRSMYTGAQVTQD